MTPGSQIKVRSEWARVYRRPGTSLEGTVVEVSDSGTVARVRLDEVQDTWIKTEHLAAVYGTRPRQRISGSRNSGIPATV